VNNSPNRQKFALVITRKIFVITGYEIFEGNLDHSGINAQ